MTAQDVLSGKATWAAEQAEALAFLRGLPADSCSLVFGSPPYERARLYLEGGEDLGVARRTEEWVAWMLDVYREALRVCTGLVAFVVEGQTEDYRYSCGPLLLAADLHRAGVNLRRPAFFHWVGIPGSGGPDWLRGDTEFVICATRPGRLPWSDNTACGHPPKWAPGGEMSNRLTDGTRVNQCGKTVGNGQPTAKARKADGSRDGRKRPSHEMQRVGGEPATDPGLFSGKASGIGREKDGRPKKRLGRGTKGHEGSTKGSCAYRLHTKKARATANGDVMEEQTHLPPVLANPGNVIQQTYTADEVAALLAEAGNVVHCNVGGGQMGSKIAHANEAPFPESLCEFFIRSFCPPGGVVLDCFSGSGTTAAVAVRWGRRALACDLRKSQVELTRRRVAGVTPDLFETTRAGDV